MAAGKQTLIVLVGPTAVGKTEAAIRLAEQLQTQIVSADSRQVFKELSIGTAKPNEHQLARVPQHFIDSKSIYEAYDAGQYGRDALQLIHQLFRHFNTLILVGGSGLYVKAVCEGFDEMPEVPAEVRSKIIQAYRQYGLNWLQDQLRERDPDYFALVDQHNPQRLMRALELLEVTHQPNGVLRSQSKLVHSFNILKIGLELPRERLFQRIDARMDIMIASGLFEEARKFFHLRHLNALQTVGYREIMEHLEGRYDYDEAVRLLKRNSRRYAKRQLTWFKKDAAITWFHPDHFHELVDFVQQHL
jgi:tRNA dimethylallyltransferase